MQATRPCGDQQERLRTVLLRTHQEIDALEFKADGQLARLSTEFEPQKGRSADTAFFEEGSASQKRGGYSRLFSLIDRFARCKYTNVCLAKETTENAFAFIQESRG